MNIDSRWIASAALAAALVVTSAAHAQWMGLRQDHTLHLGAAVGQSHARNFCGQLAPSGFGSCDEHDLTWKVNATYQFHPYLAVEAGFIHLGKFRASGPAGSVDQKVRAFELLGIFKLPLTKSLSQYYKAGFARWDSSGLRDDDAIDFVFGVGLSFALNRNVEARLEWQRYSEVSINTITLGAAYSFR